MQTFANRDMQTFANRDMQTFANRPMKMFATHANVCKQRHANVCKQRHANVCKQTYENVCNRPMQMFANRDTFAIIPSSLHPVVVALRRVARCFAPPNFLRRKGPSQRAMVAGSRIWAALQNTILASVGLSSPQNLVYRYQ
jgi:hypothetical protein